MMVWTAPWALAGLLLLAGPILVHMLLRRNARRVVFPTTRFLPRTRASAVRFRRPSDIRLLILRTAIVLAAVLACAQPVLLSAWRMARWNQRTARAVVVDTSRSVPATSDAARLAAQELSGFAPAKFATADVRDGLQRAADWLAQTPPARREIVVVSDFQRGSIDAEAIARVPSSIGLRFIRAGAPSATATLPGIAEWRGGTWQARVTVRGDAVDVVYAAAQTPAIGAAKDQAAERPENSDSRRTGAFVATRQPETEAAAAAAAVAGAASFGTTAVGDHRAVVAFVGAPAGQGEQPLTTPWMLRAALTLRQSALLRETGAGVTFAETAGVFVVNTDVHASSAAAPGVVRAVMLALRPPEIADPELETMTIPDSELAAWRRDPGVVDRGGAVLSDGVEARWLWGIALLLLTIETWLRRRRTSAQQEIRANAA